MPEIDECISADSDIEQKVCEKSFLNSHKLVDNATDYNQNKRKYTFYE